MLKSIACALALAASLPFTAAAEDRVVKREVVRFDDLNLATPGGITALERRINAAARRVCNSREGRGLSRVTPRDMSNCMDNALASARQQVAAKTGASILRG